jgi:hypothetical protein
MTMSAERLAHQPPTRRAAEERVKNRTISRAKRSTAMPGWARWHEQLLGSISSIYAWPAFHQLLCLLDHSVHPLFQEHYHP